MDNCKKTHHVNIFCDNISVGNGSLLENNQGLMTP